MATKATTLWALATVKNYLGITDASQDALVTQIADAVSQRIESFCGDRVFVTRAFTDEFYDGDQTRFLRLRRFPVTTFTSLAMKDTPDGDFIGYVEQTDFDLDYRLGRLRMRNLPLRRGFQNIKVTYTAGFGAQDAVTLPADVLQAGLDYVKLVYDEKTSGAIAATQVNLGPSNLMLKPGIPWGVKAVLDSWRVRRL
jgi:uncharacterized phiE125 gp8 family phage protein